LRAGSNLPPIAGNSDLSGHCQHITRLLIVCLAALAGSITISGCADGPIPELRSLNPWLTKDWKEDEKYTATYHRKVADLADLRGKASSLPPAEQQRYSADLAVELQREKAVPMRVALVKTLSTFPTPQARAAIQLAATDQDSYVRREVCVALAKTPDAEALQTIGDVLAKDADADVRVAAAKALGTFKDPQAAQALAVAIDDNNPALQQASMDSLRAVTGKDYGYSASAWREYMQGGSPTPPPAPSLAQQFRENYWWW
jgi:hypothetical protein